MYSLELVLSMYRLRQEKQLWIDARVFTFVLFYPLFRVVPYSWIIVFYSRDRLIQNIYIHGLTHMYMLVKI